MPFGQVYESRTLNVTSMIACGHTFVGVFTRSLLDSTFNKLRFGTCVYMHRLRLLMFYCGFALSSISICVKHLAGCALTGPKSDPKE